MPSNSLQAGSGYDDFGPALQLKQIYQKGGQSKRKNVTIAPLPLYYPRYRVQHGAGIGSLFIPLFRYLAPIVQPLLSKGFSAIKKELVSAGTDILNDPAPLKQALNTRGKKAVENLSEKAANKIKTMVGAGKTYKRKHPNCKQKHSLKRRQRERKARPKKRIKINHNDIFA